MGFLCTRISPYNLSDMSLRLSFISGEIIVPGTPIHITAHTPLDEDSCRNNVQLVSAKSRVDCTLHFEGRVAVISTSDLPSNFYSLHIGRIHDCQGNFINEHTISSNLIIRAIQARVPKAFSILHVAQLAVGELTSRRLRPGEDVPDEVQYIEAVRLLHRQTSRLSTEYFDEDGDRIDGRKLLENVDRRRARKFGRLQESLWKQLQVSSEEETHEVIIWPQMAAGNRSTPRSPRSESEANKRSRRTSVSTAASKSKIMTTLRGLGCPCHHIEKLPRVRTTLTKAQVRGLAQNEHVGRIFAVSNDHTVLQARPSLRTSLAISRTKSVHDQGILGLGIKVAVWEEGPANTNELGFVDRFTQAPVGLGVHARLVSGIIQNFGDPAEPRGYAPECSLYSANDFDDAAFVWAVEQDCSVINHSAGLVISEATGELLERDVMNDYVATHSPFPTIVNAAGNYRRPGTSPTDGVNDFYVTAKSYNALCVGFHNNQFFENASGDRKISDWSNFLNPTSPHQDRELPDVAGPGENVNALGITLSGTSFAAPAVAGAVALIQSVRPDVLVHSPEACRAIILAGAGRNVQNGRWAADVAAHIDGRDGAGAMDVDASVKITQREVRGQDTLPRWPHGWTTKLFTSPPRSVPEFRVAFRHKVVIPSPVELGIFGDDAASLNLRCVICWSSRVVMNLGEPFSRRDMVTIDLNLKLLDGRTKMFVAGSASFDNNYEVVGFAPLVGHEYEIVVEQAEPPTDEFEGEKTTVAIAWCLFYNDEAI